MTLKISQHPELQPEKPSKVLASSGSAGFCGERAETDPIVDIVGGVFGSKLGNDESRRKGLRTRRPGDSVEMRD